MSIPNKILWLLGYNNLAFILEQERQHWLLKTDKKKQIQDKITGDMFQGQIDNIGSDIILNTEKLPITNNAVVSIKYETAGISRILQLQSSAFTYSSCVNGLMFARIVSSSYPITINGEIQYKNYKLQMTNCVKCIIPFAGSNNSSDVFAGKWIKTNTPPSILMMDNKGQYTIKESLSFNGATNCTWYYPLTETLQPLDLIKETSTTYTTTAVNNDGLIGYPLYWFTCDETDIGPTISIENNTNENNDEFFFVANEGNASKYNAKIYTGLSGDKGTPTGESTSNFQIRVECEDDYVFTNNESDFNIPIKVSSISLYDTTNDVDYNVGMTIDGESSYVTMTKNDAWSYVDESHYSIEMSVFDINGSTTSPPLISAFDVYFDQSIPFENTTTDIGFAGIRLGSSNISSDIYPKYPYNLSDWDGLPEWMNDISNEGQVNQHSCIYAIHNTPTYDESNPSSRQVAALLLDPGKAITENSDETTENDERGRVYVLSNDEAKYENNSILTYPKPARTVARICDIPTSVVQLSGLSGIAPTNVVDKKYVRSEASYTEADKNRLYNVLIDKWIKPSHLDENGKPITDRVNETDNYVFNTLDGLNSVDLVNHNDVRIYENLNPLIDSHDVVLGNIHTPGSGYQINDIGVIIVGGLGFNYSVTEVDVNGGVTNVEIIPTSIININLSNFDMPDDTESGYTEPYGTSPITGHGTGLKLRFLIKDYKSKATTRGEIVDGLYALVKEFDGLWLYEYIINQTSSTTPKTGEWTKQTLISEFNNSSHSIDGGLTIKDSYLTMNIPILHDIEIFKTNPDKTISEFTNIKAFTTSNFINIVDNDHAPYITEGESSTIPVDINGYSSYHVGYCFAKKHTDEEAINAINDTGKVIDDCFVFWRWNGTNKEQSYQNCLSVVFIVVRHKFANLLSNDTTSILPNNNLNYKKYVNSNSSTTVVWNDPKVGPMVWVYNPISPTLETYTLDKHGDINVSRRLYTWSDIPFPYDANESDKDVDLPRLFDNDGKLNWNIATNKREYVIAHTSENIYQQPELVNKLLFGTSQDNNKFKDIRPIGQWQLVLPRIDSYTLTDGSKTVTPVRLTTLSGNNIGNPGMLTDSNGNDVRNKTMIIDSTSSGVKLRLFNSTKESWDEV